MILTDSNYNAVCQLIGMLNFKYPKTGHRQFLLKKYSLKLLHTLDRWGSRSELPMQSSYKNKKKYKTRKNEEKRGKTRKNEEKLLLFIVSMLFVSIMATYFNIAYNDLQCQSMNFGNESYSDYFFSGMSEHS